MLIEFSVGNALSFKDRVTLSMVAGRDTTLPENVIRNAEGTNLSLLKTAAIYGANASGKSNLVASLMFMRSFVQNSSKEGQKDSPIDVVPFKLYASMPSKPTTLEIIFLHEGIRYIYGFSADSKRIYREWLFSNEKKKMRRLFERIHESRSSTPLFKYSSYWKGEKKRLEKITRPNALFISVAAQFNNKQAEIVFGWFAKKLRAISDFPTYTSEHYFTCDLARNKPTTKAKIIKFLEQADPGIKDFNIKKVSFLESKEFIQMPEEMKKQFVRNLPKGAKPYTNEITTIHAAIDSKAKKIDVLFGFEEESEGTQKLFSISGPWSHVLEKGYTLVVDELDVRLHPLLTRWLIQTFHNQQMNPKGAQLIFTTHDSSLLEKSLFRRDQIWFTEKSAEGASNLYSLWDFKEGRPRKEENLQKGYLAGRYGAIPILENWEHGRS